MVLGAGLRFNLLFAIHTASNCGGNSMIQISISVFPTLRRLSVLIHPTDSEYQLRNQSLHGTRGCVGQRSRAESGCQPWKLRGTLQLYSLRIAAGFVWVLGINSIRDCEGLS
jgi:hypothetical protein